MTKSALIVALAVSASFAFAQSESNSIIVTASRSMTLQPDQVVFYVDVSSDVNTTLDDVLAALAGSGISIANFQSVSSPPPWSPSGMMAPAPTVEWSFSLPVPWAKMKDTITMLAALQTSVPQKNSALTLSFSVQGMQISAQLLQMQTCSVPDLLSDARAQAQKLANAANLVLGAVLAMSSSTSTDTSSGQTVLYYPYSLAPSCSVTVKFALTR